MNKYSREIKKQVYVDVYDILLAFRVENPALQHAIKKMLAPGQRGIKDKITDMKEAIISLERAIELEEYNLDKLETKQSDAATITDHDINILDTYFKGKI